MAQLKTILVTGANGQLGSEFKVLAPGFADYKFIFVSREQLAIDDVEAVAHFFSTQQHIFFLHSTLIYVLIAPPIRL